MAHKQTSTLCILGCGNLGGAILKSLLHGSTDEQNAIPFTRFIACVRSQESEDRLTAQFIDDPHVVVSRDAKQAVDESDVVVLAVDPSVVPTVLGDLRNALRGKFLISVVAGWTRSQLEMALFDNLTTSTDRASRVWVARTLPNIAASVSQSCTAIEIPEISEPQLPPHYRQLTDTIFNQIGQTVHIPPSLMDAATVVAGSTPAFFAVIVDAMIDAAVAVGVPRDLARQMTVQAMQGSATLLQMGMHPAQLRDQGTSPEGCTIGGLMVLEEAGVRGHVGRAVREAVTIARLIDGTSHVNDTRQ
ncbi:pyrroline-5-carboxylate reductase dimerization-domain-containing protein [Aspergillus coremiiformis]|uniref:Pyrroline-5-carboxylate reductase dimerization-domain-containing protein n=1 Tax=Aspergillus coremiiformis TaxID=138285 RepID=A0A5N6Z749_9EURO|nr:pyrroline-5-carboxylate reductase dimerization-domain-containing protein [Aspergillus coremiiformis]